jgi:mannose-6-phosphate isomerase-like protein (cupin superfamily)
VVPLDSVPVERSKEGVRVASLISRERSRANLLLGACWMAPGEETNSWSWELDDPALVDVTHYGPLEETYFVLSGRLRLTWDQGELDFGPEDAVYLAPGWRYRLKNIGDTEAFFIWSMPAMSLLAK